MIVPFALAQLIARCAPHIGPVTMIAIVMYESGARPFAIGDNTARRSYDFSDRDRAAAFAGRLLEAGHDIDVGYAQVNSGNFAAYGLDASSAFEPCTNLATGGRILRGDYRAATRTYGPGQNALMHALSAYNTGGYWSGLGYARAVYATAAQLFASGANATLTTRNAPQRAVAFRPLHPGTP
jgi:type IV secretion system protein VirB1